MCKVAGKRNSGRKTIKAPTADADASRALREQEAKFPSYLSPIIQCKHSVLALSRIEFYGGIIFGAIVWVLPVSSLTRSLILLFALAPMVDVVWRSPWSHPWTRVSKIKATVFLVAIYLTIAATMIFHDHGAAALTIKTYVSGHADRLFRWLYFVAGFAVAYSVFKSLPLVKGFLKSRKAEKIAARQKFRDAQKGWLDYRLDAEVSSRRLHSLVARMARVTKWMALMFTHKSWFIGNEEKDSPIVRKQAASWLLAFVLNKSSERLEPDLEELEWNANLFITSTEGHLKMATKQGDLQVAELHEYFQAQLKDVREVASGLSRLPPAFGKAKGTSRELNAALDRSLSMWRQQVEVLRKLQEHCARMVKQTRAGFERALEKPLMELASVLVKTVETMAEGVTDELAMEKVNKVRELAREAGIDGKRN